MFKTSKIRIACLIFLLLILVHAGKESEVEAMEGGGNQRVNAAFEATIDITSSKVKVEKPNPRSGLEVRDQFITAKYRDLVFFDASNE